MCTNREFGHPTHCILHTQYILHTVVLPKPVVLPRSAGSRYDSLGSTRAAKKNARGLQRWLEKRALFSSQRCSPHAFFCGPRAAERVITRPRRPCSAAEFRLQIWSDWFWRFSTRPPDHLLKIRICRGTKPVSCSPAIFILFSLQLFVFPKKCTWFRRLVSQFMLISHRRRWRNLQNSSKFRCFIRVLSCILPPIRCLTAHNKIKNETKTFITS